MRSTLMILAVLTTLAFAGFAAAQNTTNVNVPTPNINVNDNDGNNGPHESTGFFGLNTTVVIVLIVLAILVIALIVALASRPGYP